MSIRPVDLPELRTEALLHQDERGDLMMGMWRSSLRARNADSAAFKANEAEYVRLRWRHEIRALGTADLFFATEPMVELALSAAASLPSFAVDPEDLPTPTGLMVLGRPIERGVRYLEEHFWPARALLWSTVNGMLSVTPYVFAGDVLEMVSANGKQLKPRGDEPQLMAMPSCMFGTPFGSDEWLEAAPDSTSPELLPFLISAWLLMRQPLAVSSDVEPDRAVRKRLRRAGQEPKPVRVIELRRPKSSGESGDGESNYHHQWIVKGHWRQHWYPKRQVHRPVWIAPHIKGPEGAPLIGGEKVYALKR